jgi:hypothetical protein
VGIVQLTKNLELNYSLFYFSLTYVNRDFNFNFFFLDFFIPALPSPAQDADLANRVPRSYRK